MKIDIESVTALQVDPDELLVITLPENTGMSQLAEFRRAVIKLKPEWKNRVAVVVGKVDFTKIKMKDIIYED